jgi:hypothetical protein
MLNPRHRYVPADPGAPDEQSGKGQILLSFGKLFEKGLTIGTGQVSVDRIVWLVMPKS